MRKRTKVLITITVLWALIALIDFAAVSLIGHTIFCVLVRGGEIVESIGLGYTISIFYPLTVPGESSVYFGFNFWPCIIGIALLVTIIVFDIVITKNKNSTKTN